MKGVLHCESEYNRGAGCGKTARPDLYGGLYENEVPTISVFKCLIHIHHGRNCLTLTTNILDTGHIQGRCEYFITIGDYHEESNGTNNEAVNVDVSLLQRSGRRCEQFRHWI